MVDQDKQDHQVLIVIGHIMMEKFQLLYMTMLA